MSREQPPPEVIAKAVARIASTDWERRSAQIAATGGCAHPVRLQGTLHLGDPATGELTASYSTSSEPDGVLLKACRTRRASRCPACAAVYKGDARQVILAGLIGGKGVDPVVAGRPLVFATLTAPSYGLVHHQPDGDGVCHPALLACPCGGIHTCDVAHPDGDPRSGTPLCPDSYDYSGAIIFNNRAGELWRRTTINTRRQLARRLGTTTRNLHQQHRLAYLKIVEYQTRGAIHLHALLRLDPADTIPVRPEAVAVDSVLLALAVTDAIAATTAPNVVPDRPPIRWGTRHQIDIVPVDGRGRLAGYLAKYTTKSVDTGGALDHRLHRHDLAHFQLDDHLRQLVQTAWDLGGRPDLADCRLRDWAHNLGYRGHWLTKSPNWSTTLTALRQDRHHHQARRAGRDPDQPSIGHWTYSGRGHQTDGDTWLAENHQLSRAQQRRIAWEERP
jgi:hypothetical protein